MFSFRHVFSKLCASRTKHRRSTDSAVDAGAQQLHQPLHKPGEHKTPERCWADKREEAAKAQRSTRVRGTRMDKPSTVNPISNPISDHLSCAMTSCKKPRRACTRSESISQVCPASRSRAQRGGSAWYGSSCISPSGALPQLLPPTTTAAQRGPL